MSSAVEHVAAELDQTLGGPEPLRFPEGWTLSESWKRAQSDDAVIGPTGPARWSVILGDGDRHRLTFAIYSGEIVAECDCKGWRHRDWCAHVALLWWRWSRARLAVVDVDTGRTHLTPPPWASVEG